MASAITNRTEVVTKTKVKTKGTYSVNDDNVDDDVSSKVDSFEYIDSYDMEIDHNHGANECYSLLSTEVSTTVTFEKCVLTLGHVSSTSLYESIRQLKFEITDYKPSLIIQKENASVEDITKIKDLLQNYLEHKQTSAQLPVLFEDHQRFEKTVKNSCGEKNKVSVGFDNTQTSKCEDVEELTNMFTKCNMGEERKVEVKHKHALEKVTYVDKNFTNKRNQSGERNKISFTPAEKIHSPNLENGGREPDPLKTKDQVMPTDKEKSTKNELFMFQAPKERVQSTMPKHNIPPMNVSCSDCVKEDVNQMQEHEHLRKEADNISQLKDGDSKEESVSYKKSENVQSQLEKSLGADKRTDIVAKHPVNDVKMQSCAEQQLKMQAQRTKDEKYNLETSTNSKLPIENSSELLSEEKDIPRVVYFSKKEIEFKALKFYFDHTEYTSYFTKEPTIEIEENSEQGQIFMELLKDIGTLTIPFGPIDPASLTNINLDENVKIFFYNERITLVGEKKELKAAKSKIISLIGNLDQLTQWPKKQKTPEEDEYTNGFDVAKRNKEKVAGQGAYSKMEKEQLELCKRADESQMQAQKRYTLYSDRGSVSYCGHKNPKLSITIENSDITKLGVDVIVNAANIRLKHGGGVAKAIAKAAGEVLTRECDKYIERYKKLDVTDVFISNAGELPSKKVMHAVGPKWEAFEEKKNCAKALRQTVLRCLIEASRMNMSSIALPSISAAIFKVPKDICAKCYMDATKNYDSISHSLRMQPLKHILFVDVDTNLLNTIQDHFLKNWELKPDDDQIQEDIEFVMRHCSQMQEKEYKSTSSKNLSEEKKTLSADTRNVMVAERELEDYVIGDILLRVRTEPAVNFKADLNIILGHAFNKLSGIPDLNVKKHLSSPKDLPEKKGIFKYFLLNKSLKKTQESTAALLCTLLPVPNVEDDIKTIFKNMNELVKTNLLKTEKGKSPSSVTFTSSFLFPENLKEKNLNKLVGKFADKLFEFLENLSKTSHTITKVTVCASEATAPQVTKVFDSRNPKKVSRKLQGHCYSKKESESGKSDTSRGMNRQGSPSRTLGGKDFSNVKSESRSVYDKGIGSHLGGASYNQDLGSPIDILEDSCCLCYESIDMQILKCCQALICSTCLDKVTRCPFCRCYFKILIGTQPNGYMRCYRSRFDVEGFDKKGSFVIEYHIPCGVQNAEHPHPGRHYNSVIRQAFLPATEYGFNALCLLRVAFFRHLIFTIDVSNTTQNEGIVWNIHHKTSRGYSANGHGYPDERYLDRLMYELKENGVTEYSLTHEERRLIQEFQESLWSTPV